jgi:hypothetical protein
VRTSFPTRVLIALLSSIALVACETGPPLKTASDRPEAFIPGVSPKRAQAAIIDRAMARGWTLEKQTENSVAVTKPTDNMMASVLLGSAYDPNVIDRVRFTTIELNGGTKVYVTEELVTNHGSAFERVTPLQNNKNFNGLQSMLENLKRQFTS